MNLLKVTSIYIIFIEKSILITKEFGYSSLIIPNTFLTAKSYNLLRKFIVKNSSILEIFDLGENVFDDITVENDLLLLQKKISKIIILI
ncbi:MAG: Eco57I restriction-modification methylase domain-containing protein [Ignavibacteria bacterium]|nr:Eco57I restriction-modification methylase domain-containing protein [Ignavibacteria bacterium]